jgi:hypothetical protein
MGRLSNLRIVNPVLTNLAVGYTNETFVASALMPYVSVEKEAGLVPIFNKDHFKVYQTERALRAKSNRVNPGDVGTVPFALTEHDLEYPIDYREEQESAFPLERQATMSVTEGIRLRHEKMVADLVQNPNSYHASNKIALSGTDSFTDPDSDPEGVVDDAKAAVRADIVKEPNTMVIGYSMWRSLKRHPKLKAILSDNRPRLVQLADLREIFEVPNIFIGRGVFSTDAGVVTDIWGRNMVLAYVPTAPDAPVVNGMAGDPGSMRSMYEPSFGYTLRKRGQPVVDTRTEDGKLEIVRNTDIFTPFVLGADAGYLVTDAG